MPVKPYLDADGGGFVHLVGTPFVCPPGTDPDPDGQVCRGEATGPFRPPTPEWIQIHGPGGSEDATEAFVAPGGFVFTPLPPVAPPPPPPSVLAAIGRAVVGVATRIGGLVGGLLYPSDLADTDLGITAPPGGFPHDPLPSPLATDGPGRLFDPGDGIGELVVTARPIPRQSPLPSPFVAPFVVPLFDAPGFFDIPDYGTPFVPEPLAQPQPVPPRVVPRQPVILEPFPFDPPFFYPSVPHPGDLPRPGDRVDPLVDPLDPLDPFPDPGLTPRPVPRPTPIPTPFFSPFPVPDLVPQPTPRPTPRPPATPRPGTGLIPTWSPTPGLFADPGMFAQPNVPRPKDCPPCAETKERKKRKKREPRIECYRGTYTELASGLIKRRKERVPCR